MTASPMQAWVLVGLMLSVMPVACGRTPDAGNATPEVAANAATPAGDKAAAATAPRTPSAPPAAVVPRGPRVVQAAYTATLEARGTYTADSPAEVVVAVVPKAPFHINAEYPHKFSVQTKDGLTLPKDVVTHELARITPQRLEIPVALTPTGVGIATIGGELKFSVCTDEKCLMEKQQLSLSLRVGPKS
jgi:hypothetical protein